MKLALNVVFFVLFFFFKQKGNKSLGRIAQKPHIQKELGYLSIDTKKINVRAASHPIQLSHPLQSSQGAAAVKSSGKTVCVTPNLMTMRMWLEEQHTPQKVRKQAE